MANMVTLPTLEELADAGVHLGHLAKNWNPKMKPYIFAVRSRIHVINLEKTLEKLSSALDFVKEVVKQGGKILFVGTKRQVKEVVKKKAEECGMPYVTVRWLGGTFTNFKTILKTLKKLEKLEKIEASEDFEMKYTKKERLLISREIKKLRNLFAGIESMKEPPQAMFVVDVNHEQIAVKEAKAIGVKVIGLVDTNADPEALDYPIPANDDAIKAVELLAGLVSAAVKEGKEQALETEVTKEAKL